LRGEPRLRVFENMVLRRLFGTRGYGETWQWRKLHNEKLCDLYLSPHIVRVTKSRKMRWVRNVARIGSGEVYTDFRLGNRRERDNLEDPCLDGR
jgi:hypothetical protein